MSIATFVESSLRILQSEQLITGELASYSNIEHNTFCYSPCPLWSAIAHDALGFLDPGSNAFETSVIDLFSPAKYRMISAIVCTLRWRLRTYLAWEEEADGRWRRRGRGSASLPDLSTTVCAALALLGPGPLRHPRARRHLSTLARWSSPAACDSPARAQILRYFSVAGAETREVTAAVWEDCRNESQNTKLWYAVGRAWYGARLPGQSDIANLIVPLILDSVSNVDTFHDRLEIALMMCSLLDLGYTGSKLAGMFRSIMATPTYSDCQFSATDQLQCPGAIVAISLSNVVRASMRIAGPT